MCDNARFVDRHFITVDLDEGTERNIRRDERNKTLDAIEEGLGRVTTVHQDDWMHEWGHDGDEVAHLIKTLRPSPPENE